MTFVFDKDSLKPGLLAAFAITISAGCASAPVVDPGTASSAQYRTDLAECRRIAQQGGSAGRIATTTGAGAAVGAVTGEIADDEAGKGAAVGAVAGLTAGAFSADRREDRIVRNCLRDRGYRVYD